MKKINIEIKDFYGNLLKQLSLSSDSKTYKELIKGLELSPLNYIVFDKNSNEFVSENNQIQSNSIILYNTNGQIG